MNGNQHDPHKFIVQYLYVINLKKSAFRIHLKSKRNKLF